MFETHSVLSWATFWPLIGAGVISVLLAVKYFAGLSKKSVDDAARWIALLTSGLSFIYAIAAMSVMSAVLAFAGLYGLVASNVAQRTREIGLRMAVGADQRRVIQLVLGQAFRVTVVGLVLGLLLTFGVEQAMRAARASVMDSLLSTPPPDARRGSRERAAC